MHDVTQTVRDTFLSKSSQQRVGLRQEADLMSPKEAAWLAWYMCALSLGLATLGLLLLILGREAHHGVPVFELWAEETVVAVGFSTVGAIVAPRFPTRNPIGWLFCAIGLLGAVLLFSGEYAAYSLLARPGLLPAGELFAWIVSWLWVVHTGLFAFLGLLFPDGRPPTPRWRPFAWFVGAAVVVGTLAVAYSPGPIGGLDALSNPAAIEALPRLSDSVEALVFALNLAAAASLFVRLRNATGVERQQIKWFAYAAAVLAFGALISWVISDAIGLQWLHWEVGFVATVAGLAGLPVSLGIAIMRYRLHDIDLIINRTLVYGLLTAVLAGIFEVNVVALQEILLVLTHVEDSKLAYFASAMLMAALFDPLKRRIDAFVEHRLLQRNNEAGH